MDLTSLCRITQQLVAKSVLLQRQKLFPGWYLSEKAPGIFVGPRHPPVVDAAVSYCMDNLDQELMLEEEFRLKTEKFLNTKEAGKLLDSLAQYSAVIFNIDIAPILLESSLGGIQNDPAIYYLMLSPTKLTYQEKINLELTGLAEEILSGRRPSLDYFIENFGFLERRDILPCRLENREYILELLGHRVYGQPNYDGERYDLYRNHLSFAQSLNRAYIKVLGKIEDKDNFRRLFIAVRNCIKYQDNNRLLKARGFKVLGNLLNAKGLDMKITGLEDLET